MALTTNYSWDKPTVGGDSGAWGTKLNTIFDAIDTQVKNRQNEAAAAQSDATKALAELLTFAPTSAAEGFGGAANGSDWQPLAPAAITIFASAPGTTIYIPLRRLAVGHRITAFSTRGAANVTGANSMQASLVRVSQAGVETSISAGHAITSGDATRTTSGLSHDVIADERYFVKVVFAGGGTGTGVIRWAQPTVTRP